MESFWDTVNGTTLRQGDYLPECLLPILYPDFGVQETHDIPVGKRDLIIVTQSCDLENNKAMFVSLCPIYAILDYQEHFQFRSEY